METTREVYERAISNIPMVKEKRHWRRYIYLWINYALYEELQTKVNNQSNQLKLNFWLLSAVVYDVTATVCQKLNLPAGYSRCESVALIAFVRNMLSLKLLEFEMLTKSESCYHVFLGIILPCYDLYRGFGSDIREYRWVEID